METFDPASLITTIVGGGTAGLIAFLLIALWTGKQGVWVWGREQVETKAQCEIRVTEANAERDKANREMQEWKELALVNTGLLEQAASRKVPGDG